MQKINLEQQKTITELQNRISALENECSALRNSIFKAQIAVSKLKLNKSFRLMKLLNMLFGRNGGKITNLPKAIYNKVVHGKPLMPEYNVLLEITEALKTEKNGANVFNFSRCSRKENFAGTVYIFASVPYDDIGGGQRSAQLSRCLLKRMYKVIYIYKYPKVENGIPIINEYTSPQFTHLYFDNIDAETVFNQASADAQVIFEFPHPDFLAVLNAAAERKLETVYELIDPWDTSLGGNWYTEETEKIFAEKCSKITATAKILREKLLQWKNDVSYIPNAADPVYFNSYKSLPRPADFPAKYKKNILYFGSMYGEWFDWGALKLAARGNPAIGFIMIGEPPQILDDMPENIIFTGMKSNSELSAYLMHSDTALIPFTPGKIVNAVSPIKVFEYIFCGKPVITFDMPEVEGYPGVYRAKDVDEFVKLCSLESIQAPNAVERDIFTAKNSWDGRLDSIITLPRLKHTYSIVILIHNNADIIRRTLDTLLFHTAKCDVEIIVVDNASTDNGAEIVAEHYSDKVKLLKNPQNGCSSGRNLGAAHAKNEILVFFDSDQYFSSCAWLYDYDMLCDLHPQIGAFSWNAGFFASEDLTGPIVDYMPDRGTTSDEYIKYGFRTDIHYLATSGLFIPKKLFDDIDGLDTAYDPTIFEDTDLSMKVVEAGYQIAYRDFPGIQHQPHQTTKASDRSSAYRQLFERNSSYFKTKWSKQLQEINFVK